MATYSTEDHERIGAAVRQDVRDVVEHKRLFEWAAECIRRLIEEIRLVPADGKLRVELYGELAIERVRAFTALYSGATRPLRMM